MELYHGSLDVVQRPEIRQPSRTLDYGAGFYTTTSERQATDWVRRHKNEGCKVGYVNVYEADMDALRCLKGLWFDSPTEAWLDFVMANRNDPNFYHAYDIVFGPVANDRVYASFALYESGILNKQDLIKELRTFRLVDQMLFHTDRALACLNFLEAKEIQL